MKIRASLTASPRQVVLFAVMALLFGSSCDRPVESRAGEAAAIDESFDHELLRRFNEARRVPRRCGSTTLAPAHPLAAELTLTGDLWEYRHLQATCEDPEDHADDDSVTWTVRLAAPEPTCSEMRLTNKETFGGDYADFTVRTLMHDPNELIDWTNQPSCP